ncbi:DUF6059 family protein [Streptomyces sp. 184]|uniref:DUF6059 family protein n=1 Tax=Streptomyces sp. 184 TaxID=1827526 RepID=UPI003891621D
MFFRTLVKRVLVDGLLRQTWAALVALGSFHITGAMRDAAAEPGRRHGAAAKPDPTVRKRARHSRALRVPRLSEPPPGHPERLLPDAALTEQEELLLRHMRWRRP